MSSMADVFEFDRRDQLESAERNGIKSIEELPASGSEVFSASRKNIRYMRNLDAGAKLRQPYREQNREKFTELTGEALNPVAEGLSDFVGQMFERGEITRGEEGELQYNSVRAKSYANDDSIATRQAFQLYEMKRKGLLMGDAFIDDLAAKDLAKIKAETEKTMARSSGFSGGAANFAGMAIGAIQDPLTLATLPVGAGFLPVKTGAGILANAGKAFLFEGAVAGAIEAPIELAAYNRNKSFGINYTAKEAAYNTLGAVLGAGLFRAAGSTAIDVGAQVFKRKLTAKTAQDAVTAYRKSVEADPTLRTPEGDRAAEVLEGYSVESARARVAGVAEPEERLHFDALDKAHYDLSVGRTVNTDVITQNMSHVNEPIPNFKLDLTTRTGRVLDDAARVADEAPATRVPDEAPRGGGSRAANDGVQDVAPSPARERITDDVFAPERAARQDFDHAEAELDVAKARAIVGEQDQSVVTSTVLDDGMEIDTRGSAADMFKEIDDELKAVNDIIKCVVA